MKTIVVQSFRTTEVPQYVSTCCGSVKAWARSAGYAYQFFDDSFLALAPAWYRHKAGSRICVVADVARLILAEQMLAKGFDRVVWCDADLLIFRPELLTLDALWTGTYCKEVWIHKDASGSLVPVHKVNNSMCVFRKPDLGHLAEYIAQCLSVVQSSPEVLGDLSVGTDLLTDTYRSRALISTVGIVSPHLMVAILGDDRPTLLQYVEWQDSPVYAANLCNALRPGFGEFSRLFDYLCDSVVERLRSGEAGDLLSTPIPHF